MKEPSDRWDGDTPIDYREYRLPHDRFAALHSDCPVAIAGTIEERVNGKTVETTLKQPGWVIRNMRSEPYPILEVAFPEGGRILNLITWGP